MQRSLVDVSRSQSFESWRATRTERVVQAQRRHLRETLGSVGSGAELDEMLALLLDLQQVFGVPSLCGVTQAEQ